MKKRNRIRQEDMYTQPFCWLFPCRSDVFLSNPEAPPAEKKEKKKKVNRSHDDTDNTAVLQEEDWFYYLALQVFLQHLWDGMLQHLLISKLVKINKTKQNKKNTSSVR